MIYADHRRQDKSSLGIHQGGDANLEGLIQKYAPIGRQLRRQRNLRSARVAVASTLAIGLAVLSWQLLQPPATPLSSIQRSDTDASAARVESALAEFRQLREQVTAETGALAAQRADLALQRQRFEERSAALMKQLDAVNSQGASLAKQLEQFESQRVRLEATLAQVAEQQRQLETQQARSDQATPELSQQLAEIGRQRQRLQEQQQQVRDQGQLLAREIDRINAQRLELERQRETIEQQREEVQALLNQIREVGMNRMRERHDAVARAESEKPGALATVAAVNDRVLGEMRGGVDVGDDYTVSVGVTRTGTINGVEQFTNAMYIEDLTKVTSGSLPNIEGVIIQNGPGNSVTPELGASVSESAATIIQNTLDNQDLASQTIIDVTLQNVSTITQGISASDAMSDSLLMQR